MTSAFKPKNYPTPNKTIKFIEENQLFMKKRLSIYSTVDSVDQWNRRQSKINQTIKRNSNVDSILKLKDTRCDAYGQEIIKGGKAHRVSFVDVVTTETLAEILVDYKDKENNNTKGNCYCNPTCLII